MKTKAFLLILIAGMLLPLSSTAQSMAVTKKAVKEALAEVLSDNDSVNIIRDTVIKNATQYELDSLRYSAEIQIAKLKLKQKQDSAVYANLSKDQIFEMEMRKDNRYYRSSSDRFWMEVFPVLFIGVCVVLGLSMLISARDKGKKRAHEYRMAQITAHLAEEKVIISAAQEDKFRPQAEKESIFAGKKYSSGFFSNLKNPARYKDSSVMFILASFAWGFLFIFSNSDGWVLGIIPFFIGLGYLYLYYSNNQNAERSRRERSYFEDRNRYRSYDQRSDKEDQEEQQD